MADLKCAVENCSYYKDCLCSKGDIMVGGKHACDVTVPAVKVLHRKKREWILIPVRCLIPAEPSVLIAKQ